MLLISCPKVKVTVVFWVMLFLRLDSAFGAPFESKGSQSVCPVAGRWLCHGCGYSRVRKADQMRPESHTTLIESVGRSDPCRSHGARIEQHSKKVARRKGAGADRRNNFLSCVYIVVHCTIKVWWMERVGGGRKRQRGEGRNV